MSPLVATIRRRLLVAAIALIITLVYVLVPNALHEGIEHFFYDTLTSWSPPIAKESRIVIVDIDEPSLEKYGAWPWSRTLMAELVSALTQRHRVGLLGIDIVFPEQKPGDDKLKTALSRPEIIMSQALDFSPQSQTRVGQLGDVTGYADRVNSLPSAKGYIGNHPGLMPAGARVGHISPLLDSDGRVRRMYPMACVDTVCTLALSLRMYAQLTETDRASLTLGEVHGTPALHLSLMHNQSLDLPVDDQQALIIPYRVRPGGFQTLSAVDILQSGNALPQLENSVVLLGSTALGIGDRITTPLGKLTPGIEVHAQLLTALLDRSFIRPVSAGSVEFIALAAFVVISFLVWPARGRYMGLAWPAVMLTATGALLTWLLLAQGLWLPLSAIPVLIVTMSVLFTAQENLALSKRMRTLGSQFSQFLPSSLVGRLLQDRKVGPETELHTMTVLIVDIRGFTAASEGKTPAQIAEFAQRCFEVLSAEVARYHGTIEKYTGDGLMALWGVPTEDAGPPRHQKLPAQILYVEPSGTLPDTDTAIEHAPYAVQAVSAAIAMQNAIAALAPWFMEKGYGQLQLSMGLNTGPMSVGVFGGLSHLAWSAQGQAFNIASRIEQLTRVTGKHLLMGETTARLIDQKYLGMVGQFAVKGVSYPVAVYELLETRQL